MAPNKASDVSAADWLSNSREKFFTCGDRVFFNGGNPYKTEPCQSVVANGVPRDFGSVIAVWVSQGSKQGVREILAPRPNIYILKKKTLYWKTPNKNTVQFSSVSK